MLLNAGQEKKYTAKDYSQLFEDANLPLAKTLSEALVGNVSVAKNLPKTHFYGFYGSGKRVVSLLMAQGFNIAILTNSL